MKLQNSSHAKTFLMVGFYSRHLKSHDLQSLIVHTDCWHLCFQQSVGLQKC